MSEVEILRFCGRALPIQMPTDARPTNMIVQVDVAIREALTVRGLTVASDNILRLFRKFIDFVETYGLSSREMLFSPHAGPPAGHRFVGNLKQRLAVKASLPLRHPCLAIWHATDIKYTGRSMSCEEQRHSTFSCLYSIAFVRKVSPLNILSPCRTVLWMVATSPTTIPSLPKATRS